MISRRSTDASQTRESSSQGRGRVTGHDAALNSRSDSAPALVGDVLEHVGAGDDADDRAVALHEYRGRAGGKHRHDALDLLVGVDQWEGAVHHGADLGAQRVGVAEELVEQTALLHRTRDRLHLDPNDTAVLINQRRAGPHDRELRDVMLAQQLDGVGYRLVAAHGDDRRGLTGASGDDRSYAGRLREAGEKPVLAHPVVAVDFREVPPATVREEHDDERLGVVRLTRHVERSVGSETTGATNENPFLTGDPSR